MGADYDALITVNNIFEAWIEFRRGKRRKIDVQRFERHLEDNLYDLYFDLKNKTYKHSSYQSFYVHDPKQRHIHKASVRDRVVHHLLYTYLYEVFDKSFLYDSYSCRIDKGTHRGIVRLVKITRKISQNYTKPCWVLKCDVKKFFASVDHEVLLKILEKKISDKTILWLLKEVTYSFHSYMGKGKGIPLGNLTSQVFANIYLNELDQYVKHVIKVKHYIRYADDFLFVSDNKKELEHYVQLVGEFLQNTLNLQLHPQKIILRKLNWGIDFLGYIVLPHYILPRTKTKKRMFKKLHSQIQLHKKGELAFEKLNQTTQSYLGYLSHSNSYNLTKELKNQIWFWLTE